MSIPRKHTRLLATAVFGLGAMGAATFGNVGPAAAKVDGDTIILGSAMSLTGKFSSSGVNTQRGYDFAVERINSMGGVKVRSEERRVGKECVSTCRSRWSRSD